MLTPVGEVLQAAYRHLHRMCCLAFENAPPVSGPTAAAHCGGGCRRTGRSEVCPGPGGCRVLYLDQFRREADGFARTSAQLRTHADELLRLATDQQQAAGRIKEYVASTDRLEGSGMVVK